MDQPRADGARGEAADDDTAGARRALTPLEEHRRRRARPLAGLFAAGGTLSAVVVALPGWSDMRELPIFLLAVLAVAGGGVLWCCGHRFSTMGVSAFLAFGTAIIGTAQYLFGGGGASASYAMLYVWVALYAAMTFRVHVVALHLAATVAVHAAVLLLLGDDASIVSRLALTLGTQIAAGVVVGRMAAHLRAVAGADPLTGLANRRSAARALARATPPGRSARAVQVGRVLRAPRAVAVVVLDLNGFKAVNDRLGHAAGDELLVRVARAWSAAVEPGWTLARTGGDEFLLVLPEAATTSVEEALRRLRAAAPDVAFSAGSARWDGAEDVGELLERADRDLYAAKAAARAPRVPFLP
nr:GGDEF domain-containing protein [uncultured Actinotalea sp.]